jgi:hypothetical protein
MPRSFWGSAGSWLAASAALGPVGCSAAAACDTSDDGNSVVTYTGGTTEAAVYTSSPWTTGWLHYPGGSRYELVHHLGRVPTEVVVYLAFSENPGSCSLCAGNSCVLTKTDDVAIGVKNDTCSEFWIRVVARSDGGPADSGAAE